MNEDIEERSCEFMFQKDDRPRCWVIKTYDLTHCYLFRENGGDQKEHCVFYHSNDHDLILYHS